MGQSITVGNGAAAAADTVAPIEPRVPRWVDEAVTSGSLEVVSAVIPNAAAMPATTLRTNVASAYLAIGQTLSAIGKTPIRLWNYLPDPAHAMGPGLDRYMVFNAGRHDGYRQWPGGVSGTQATASGVGVAGSDLTIFCLSSPDPGEPVENPRQIPAWQYSRRYGPLPPCFSRATVAVVNGGRRLLIGGTASVVGEESVHEGDAAAQLAETLRNLAAVIRAARGVPETDSIALARLTDLRMYVVRPHDAPMILDVLRMHCPHAVRIELAQAGLCRPELLVEIEGFARI